MAADDRMIEELGAEGLALPMPAQSNGYLARMARFTDGPEHARRRAALVAVLPPVPGLEAAAFERTVTQLPDRLDVSPLARSIPVAVLGEAIGVGDLTAEIAALCAGGTVAGTLPDVARTSLLFQCRDATAALVLTALADGVRVEAAAPVLRTRRAGGVWVSLADTPYGAGAHACPGREHALALAGGMVAALAGHVVVECGPDEPRPNLRMPTHLVMERR